MLKRTLVIAGLTLALIVLGGVGFILIRMGPRMAWGLLRYDQRQEGTFKVGDRAPDVTLVALDGSTRERLAARIGGRPLVLTFGSFT
jgi:hypothetical protein